ncbi:Nucleotide-binding universal stress protein, UspA family [Tistlia consotensis]|uniref:Nucleotide-binding universal stress protein, UspA family n=1 Tax=Tistlia consotensis USBA 355 TaxID=560819 RepID=A0A1Y6C0E0_9PROT|nr:universal stress protein [Tistlia consotensis]SMF29092.1 Nucleotide-binding universal stress protein, UspA family [Tistlia consotensis USBA 355]SNR91623.1 Nucleotide-binding universal stress protein, UspA family [Tistlia consotensis]
MAQQLILHPTDGSSAARKALEFAVDLARGRQARLLILHVQRSHGSYAVPDAFKDFERVEHLHLSEQEVLAGVAVQIAEEAEAAARALGLAEVESLVIEGDPAQRILETAETRKADLIVMGSRGLGDLQGMLLGSVSHKVAHLAPCTCVLVR